MLEPYGRRAIAIWRDIHNPPMLADTLITLGNSYVYNGSYDIAMAMHQEAVEICRKINNQWGEAYAYFIPVVINVGKLDIKRGLANTATSLELAQKSGSAVAAIYMHFFQALLFMAAGDYQQATETITNIMELVGATLVALEDQAKSLQALIYYKMGEKEQANTIVKSIEMSTDTDNFSLLVIPERAFCRYLLYQGDYKELAAISSKITDSIEAYNSYILNLTFYYFHGRALLGLNDRTGARKILERGLFLCRKMSVRWGFPEIVELLADIEEQEGNPARAAELRAEVQGMNRVL
jgi:tetratricopeptide (TPR) repeat protein